MPYFGNEPAKSAIKVGDNTVLSATIANGVIINEDIKSDAAIAMSKTALVAGTGITLATNTLNVDAAQTQITSVGTIGTGVWQGTPITSAYLNASQTAITSVGTLTGLTIENATNPLIVGDGTKKLFFDPDSNGVMVSTATSQGGDGHYYNDASGEVWTTIDGTAKVKVKASAFEVTPNAIFEGNVGIGVTPQAWDTTRDVLQIGTAGFLASRNNANVTYLGNNWYRNTSGADTYIGNDEAIALELHNSGNFYLKTAPSGTGAITWTTPLTVLNNGNATFAGDITMSQSGQAVLHLNSSGDASEVKLTSNQGTWSMFSDNAADAFLINDGTTRFTLTDTSATFAGKVYMGGSVKGRSGVKMSASGVDWTDGNWSEVWNAANTPGNKYENQVFAIDTNRAGGVTGGIVGLSFSPGWTGHQNWGIYSLNNSGGGHTQGDLVFVSTINDGTLSECVRLKPDKSAFFKGNAEFTGYVFAGVLDNNSACETVTTLDAGSIANRTFDAIQLDGNTMYEITYASQHYDSGNAGSGGWRYVRWHAYDGSGGGSEAGGDNWFITVVENTGTGESGHTPSWSVVSANARITYGSGYMTNRRLIIRALAGTTQAL